MLSAVHKFSALELCDQGQYQAAADLLGIRAGEWPSDASEGNCGQAEAILAAGVIATMLGGIQQSADLSSAREMLNESIRLFGDDPRSWTARGWLAWAEYWAGDLDKSLGITDEVLNAPIDDVTRFRSLLLRAGIYCDQDLPEKAFVELDKMVPFYGDRDALFKGKFHIQRGRVLRMLGELDRAIIEYTCAADFFRQAGSVQCEAATVNNLVNIYLETKCFDKAHECAEQARDLFHQLGDRTFEAKALDQSALIFLTEGKFDEAEAVSVEAVNLVEQGKVVDECKDTYTKIKNIREINSGNERASIRANLRSGPDLPKLKARGVPMTPSECAYRLVQNEPENAERLLDLLIWATSVRDDPQHAAELEQIEKSLYSKTDHSDEHWQSYRKSRLLKPVTSDS